MYHKAPVYLTLVDSLCLRDTAKDLEAKCKAAVESTTGAKVTRTISGSFSEAGTLFQFEVAGAQAPWQCIGYRDGSTAGVMYTGDEGAL